jgi:hypothetical protein
MKMHHLPWSGSVKFSDSFSVPSGREYGLCGAASAAIIDYGYPIVTKKPR